MIRGKIDVSKIDKTALFKGAKGTYLDVTLWETPDDKYGNDYRITQDIGKERREAGERGEILGNAKLFGGPQGDRNQASAGEESQVPQVDDNDLPF